MSVLVLLAAVGCGQDDSGGSAEQASETVADGETVGDGDGDGDPGDGDGDEPSEPSGNALDQDELFTCNGEPAMPPADIRLLDRFEWTRNVGSWHGTNLDKNPLYPRPEHRYSSYFADEALDPSVLSLYLDVVSGAGNAWTKPHTYDSNAILTVTDDPETKCFFDDADPLPECVRYFVGRLLERGTMYRPASEAQVDALEEFAQAALGDELGIDTRPATIKKIAAAAWMTADALHRTELGDGNRGALDEHGRVRLTDWELAQAMAYALGRTAPGAPAVRRKHLYWSKGDVDGYLSGFADAATDGSITDPEVVAALVGEYFGGLDDARVDLYLERGDERDWENRGEYWMAMGIRSFFREWLDYGEIAAQPPKVEVAATSAWAGQAVENSYHNLVNSSNGYENNLVEHLDDMIARILAADEDVFATLLTSRMFYTPATAGYQEGESTVWKSTSEMNRVYNVAGVTERTREARWIELPALERAGVLTHPAWLGAHALSFENDPNLVHRGKWIREELLCLDVPELPLSVDAALSDESRDQSARQRISEQLDADPYCAGCHQYMNPLGYPFEIYNHAGFVRIEDHGAAPNGSSVLANMPSPELEGPVGSAIDLSERLASSPYAKRCFIRQSFRYFAGREETQADACTMVALEHAYDDSGGSFAALLVALFNSDSFQYRVPN
ncbi:DUF1588 domain-containing protein [Enhygromyxa salina]|uniref:Cellulose-binding domain protein n=1 Tax=Enhygromyxa salina TaxID=215803 RepID=A0A2S9YXH6_9BACT|nr:DUF1588 domain-containing protein [Enhygromyxa salina]PRQ09784.1 hypothetical protein ENSA7_05390 [Enhygromyxa salina]